MYRARSSNICIIGHGIVQVSSIPSSSEQIMAESYVGLLGSDAGRFTGQTSVDIFLNQPNGLVRIRQRVECTRQGSSYAVYERSTDGGNTWFIVPQLIHRIIWENKGVSQPFDANIALAGHPPVSCLHPLQVSVLIATVSAPYFLRSFLEYKGQ